MVSICIAVYNAETFIYNTLKSIQNQTYKDFEVIIVDDHSTDNTVKIVSDFCISDNRFKFIVNYTQNQYVDAHNVSYQLAKGKYLFRIDHDDVLMPDYIEFVVNYMDEHPEVDTCCTAQDFCTYVNNELQVVAYPDDNLDPTQFNNDPCQVYYDACFCGSTFQHWHNNTSCLRKDFYDKHQPEYTVFCAGDGLFWMEVFCAGAVVRKLLDVKLHKVNTGRNTLDSNEYQTITDQCNYYATWIYFHYFDKKCRGEFGQTITDRDIALKDMLKRTNDHFKNVLINSGEWDSISKKYK